MQERLRDQQKTELRRIFEHVGADPDWWDDSLEHEWHVGGSNVHIPDDAGKGVRVHVDDDVAPLRELIRDDLPEIALTLRRASRSPGGTGSRHDNAALHSPG